MVFILAFNNTDATDTTITTYYY